MQAPRIPSFFKTPKSKKFDYKPRHYDKRKEQLEQLKKEGKKQQRLFFRKLKQSAQGKRTKNILFIIIGLFLLSYLLLT